MKTFGLATVLALLLAAPAVAATDENIGIETLLKDGWQVAGYAAANQFAVEFSDDFYCGMRTSRTSCSAARAST